MTRQRLFNFASAVSLLLFLATAFLCDWSAQWDRRFEFQRGAVRWEVAGGGGRFWVGNGPQVHSEKQKSELAMQHAMQDYRQRRAGFAAIMRQAPHDSQTYRDAEAAWDHTDAEYEAARARAQPRDATELSEYAIGQTTLLAAFAILPFIWLIVWLMRHPAARRELRHPLSLAAMILLLISLAIIVLSIRSYWVGATLAFEVRGIPEPVTSRSITPRGSFWYAASGLQFSRGEIQFLKLGSPSYSAAPSSIRLRYNRGGVVMRPPSKIPAGLPDPTHWAVPGVAYWAMPAFNNARNHSPSYRTIIVSTWLPLMLCMIFPLFWSRRRWLQLRRETRCSQNQCIACGYSMRGNASGVCPECGKHCAAPDGYPERTSAPG